MRFLVVSILALLATPFGTARAETLGYGSKAGMEVTIVEKSGIDTTRAKITVKHTRENAIAYCEAQMEEVTEDCIKEELATENLRRSMATDITSSVRTPTMIRHNTTQSFLCCP
jgi:hypothetical protein